MQIDKMTLRQYLITHTEPARAQQRTSTKLLMLAGGLFLVGQLIALFWKMGGVIIFPVPILFLTAGFMRYSAVVSGTPKIQCPVCSNKLGYLFTDKNYTHKSPFIGIPNDIPEKIDQCPYCKTGMDEEIKNTEPVN